MHSRNIPNFVGHIIDHGRLKFTRVLGSGSNGVIFLAEDTQSGSPPVEYAVKCMIKGEPNSRRYGLQRQEIQFHEMLSAHPRVVTLHRVIEDKYYFFLVMDYCRGGDFFTFLSQRRDYRGDDEHVKRMFLQVLSALQACHGVGVYHRDLKPENFLVSEDGKELYLTDFGLATTNLWSKTHGAGSSLYMSPECIGEALIRAAYNTRSNDIWALGVIFTSMISGHNPWNRACVSDACFREYVRNPGFLRDMLPISADANGLLQQIFCREHTRRITLDQIRTAVETTDTFFMGPHEIMEAGEYLKGAAESYYNGSRLQEHYMPWSSFSAMTAVDEIDDSNSDGQEGEDGDEDVDERELGEHAEQSPSSTLETDGPNTPELRAQQLHAVDIPDDAFSPFVSRPVFALDMKTGLVPRKVPVTASPNFLRRFVDRFSWN